MNRQKKSRDLTIRDNFFQKELNNDMTAMNETSGTIEVTRGGLTVKGRGVGACVRAQCGQEAACKPLPNNTYMCVCPHDFSPPTSDLKCPNRLTVPITPHPIHNIIPPVGSNVTSNNTLLQKKPSEILSPPEIYPTHDVRVLLGLASGCIFILLLCLILCCWKRKQIAKCAGRHNKNKNTSCTASPMVLKKSILVADRYTLNPQYTACSTAGPTVPLLRGETLRFLQEIGEGCFGKVFKGELRRDGSDHVEIVAIKVLKESASREAEEDFMREVDIMSAFRHANILSLIGVVLRESGMSPMMVFEYMPHGDLAEVLRANARWYPSSPGSQRHHATDMNATPVLHPKVLLSVALQIAAGMRYLAAQRFVHRDLACRNCLVSRGPVVKIADFGMSRDVYTCDYYKIGGSRLLPVRWMSPESVMYGRFTLESDIWSYGIVLWEIYSFGKQPYYGHTNEEVVKLILQGIMLIPPEDCPTLIYDLMRACWKTEPRDRIRFQDIFDKLEKAYENFEDRESTTSSQPSQVPEVEVPTKKTSVVHNVTLPRPPPMPIAQLDGLLDTDGYLLPQETTRTNYLQALPD
ncbi:Ror [Carabus blaptoides fortunei]